MVLDFGLGLGGTGLFPASSAEGQGLDATVTSQIIWKDVGVGIIPIGCVVAWFVTLFPTTPPLLPNYVQCDGQVLDDGDSPLDGQTIPNLNRGRFLRGAAASGATGGTSTHRHTLHSDTCGTGSISVADENNTGYYSTLPTYTDVVWVMRIK